MIFKPPNNVRACGTRVDGWFENRQSVLAKSRHTEDEQNDGCSVGGRSDQPLAASEVRAVLANEFLFRRQTNFSAMDRPETRDRSRHFHREGTSVLMCFHDCEAS